MSLFQVLVNGNVNTYLIKGLEPVSEYEVLLAAIYANEVESDEMVLIETTGKLKNLSWNIQNNLHFQISISVRLTWFQ